MKLFSYLIISITLLSLVGCGGGSGGDPTNTDGTLSKSTLVYDKSPRLNEELRIIIESNSSSTSNYSWKIVTQPELSNLQLNTIDSGKSVLLTPPIAGKYKISVSSSNNETAETEFYIENEFSFNTSKLEGYDGTQDVSEITGTINNQIWIYSETLSRTDIEKTITSYPDFNVIGFDEIRGLLVEFDTSKISIKEDIEKLKLEKGIDSVDYRVYEGRNSIKEGLKTPDDGSSFNDGGDNWHLEYIGMQSAWDISTGNDSFYIGITDGTGKYHSKHEDLTGRFKEATSTSSGFVDTHGTAVAGTIGAITDNKKGMSGINWITQMIGGKGDYQGLKNIISKHNTLLVNNSWSMTGYPSANFDPTDTQKVKEWKKTTLSRTRDYRKLVSYYKDKLFVWAAGNGIGNGAGNNGHYGVDGIYHNPALHYTSGGALQKKDNVLFVAALLNDNRLAYFSEHGESVDIAAPTKFKATKDDDLVFDDYYEGDSYGTNTSGGFSGTSAAAPVVTGVASLILSLDQELKASDVKSILINSATEYAQERYKAPGNAGDNNSNIEELSHNIPILNAGSALKMAKEIKEGKIAKLEHTFNDPFQPEVKIQISSANNKLTTTKFDYILGVNTANIDEIALYQDIDSGEVNGNSVLISIDPERINYSIRGNRGVEFTHEETRITSVAKYNYDFNVPHITAIVQDTVSLATIPNVSIEIQSMNASVGLPYPQGTGFTDSDGTARLYLLPGNYKIFAKADKYNDFAKIIHIQDVAQSIPVNIAMTSKQIDQVGSIGGIVYDENGSAIEGALVRISGGEQTNGFFASATTNGSGIFQISNISKIDSTGELISNFILSASATGYAESVKEGVIVLSGNSVNHNFTLIKQDLSNSIIYTTSFEQNESSWSGNGLWHEVNLSNTLIFNTLVANGYSSLPPDETTSHAFLPDADDGDSAIWYGAADTGSFILTQSANDSLNSGGTSTTSHSGEITSPLIDLSTSKKPVLRFKTWWEIEAVNPNSSGFDLMDIKIAIGNNAFETIKRLNPHVDPNDSDRKHKGFSSGGFNRVPVWVLEEIDLSDYAGQSIRIKFSFDTRDNLYNGFRGWLIDNFAIIDGSIVNSASKDIGSSNYQAKAYKSTKAEKHIFDPYSQTYIDVHKKASNIDTRLSSRLDNF